MTFEVENIQGTYTPGHIHIVGSGRLLSPVQHNDWIRTNFAICPVAGAHLGYLIAALRTFRTLRHELRQWDRVVITGHSLGGATAEVLGAVIEWLMEIPVEVHNFGGPGPWGRRPDAAGSYTWYQAGRDPVPYLMYAHLGSHKQLPGLGCLIKTHKHGYDQFIGAQHGG